MTNTYPFKQKVVLASILLAVLAGGSFLFKDELFPSPGIYIQFVGAAEGPVPPVIIALRPLSPDKVRQEFEWELPMPVPQFVVSNSDLDEMLNQTESLLPAKDCEVRDTQFVVTLNRKGRSVRREIDNNRIWRILGYLQRYSAMKYKKLSMEMLNFEDYSKMDKSHPYLPNPLELSVLKKLSQGQPIQKKKKKQ